MFQIILCLKMRTKHFSVGFQIYYLVLRNGDRMINEPYWIVREYLKRLDLEFVENPQDKMFDLYMDIKDKRVRVEIRLNENWIDIQTKLHNTRKLSPEERLAIYEEMLKAGSKTKTIFTLERSKAVAQTSLPITGLNFELFKTEIQIYQKCLEYWTSKIIPKFGLEIIAAE